MSRRSRIRFFSMVVLALLTASLANAEDRCARCGWFWYDWAKPEQKETTTTPGLHSEIIPSADPWRMDPEKFQELLANAKKEAVRIPTVDNVKQYFHLQDIARRKAAAFANVAMVVAKNNPRFDGARDLPVSAPGRKAMLQTRREEIGSAIFGARSDFALLYFHSPDCGFCDAQNGILGSFAQKYGWTIKPIDVDREPAIAAKFDIQTTPTLLLIYRGSDNHLPVSVGVSSLSEIETELYRGIRFLRGDITPEQYSLYDFQRRGYFDPMPIGMETGQ